MGNGVAGGFQDWWLRTGLRRGRPTAHMAALMVGRERREGVEIEDLCADFRQRGGGVKNAEGRWTFRIDW